MNCPRCDTEISEHQAGPETDACVAVVVMGSKKPGIYVHGPHIDPRFSDDKHWLCYPEYEKEDKCEWEAMPFSTSITNAWKVLDKYGAWVLNKREWGDLYWVDLYITEGQQGWADSIEAFTAPLAICRAALIASSQ